jgi:hypothetical protein
LDRRFPIRAIQSPRSTPTGTCLTTLLAIKRGFYLGTAWQPGPGREAGAIAC